MRGFLHRSVAAFVAASAAAGGAVAQPSEPPAGTQPPAIELQAPAGAAPAATEPAATKPVAQEPVATKDVPLAADLRGIDADVAARLRDLMAGGIKRGIDRRQDRAGVEAFYRGRGFAPLWISDGAPSPRARQAIAVLRGAEADGLNPADYPAPAFARQDADKLVQDEIALTNSVLALARHARTGRISFSRVSAAIYYELEFPNAADVLANLANTEDAGDALNAYHPQHAGYRALKAKLAQARQQKKQSEADTIMANMERWRWLPRDLGKSHVMVNIPDFTLAVRTDGKTAWTTRIVVGKVGTQATPLLTETMKFITVNPTWNVPPSIIRNEYLPALARDPNALARIGLKVTHAKDGSVRIYQPPGERNALGRIRFNFPNRFLVYQHDTPDKHLFAHDKRAYSHGCMRVQNPEQYAEVLLSITLPEERYSAERIRKMFGSGERNIKFPVPIPVHLTYQTAFVDDAGQLQLRPDLYGHDKAIVGLMRDRNGTDTPVARNYHSGSKPVTARLPARPGGEPAVRRWDSVVFGLRNEQVGRPFEFGGSTFYPRRAYGTPE